jgi:ribosome-binding protein aMBF1 (putative translation factor)
VNESVIKRQRVKKGLTINKLASRVKVSEATIKRWQNKKLSPNCRELIVLSKVLGIGIVTIVNDYKEVK